jgi:hypothetical protein
MPQVSKNDQRTSEQGLKAYQHPEYKLMYPYWVKWRLCYEGGDPFKTQYLYRYSKREDADDFSMRKKLTYVPGHSRAVINIVRNALAAVLPEVVRKGNQDYLDAMSNDVDLFQSSMASFLAVEVIPWLLVQAKVFVVLDAPPAREGATLAEDAGRPFLYSVAAENVLSWSYDDMGKLTAILMLLYEDVVDPESGLVTDVKATYRYMRLLEPGQTVTVANYEPISGPGVLVRTYDSGGNDIAEPYVLELTRVPVVEFRMVSSLMGEIADHQISLLNLASTDLDFLWRANFPLYTEQLPKAAGLLKPRATKTQSNADGTEQEGDQGAGRNDRQRRHGVGKGVGYKEGMDRPGFINPSTDNLTAAMSKEEAIIREIRVLVDLALASLSVKAIEQSGASKMADRVGEDAGLAYIGRVLESGERDVAKLWAEFLSSSEDAEVRYPQNYTMKNAEERLEEADRLRGVHSAVRSVTYQRVVDTRIAELVAGPLTTNEQMEDIAREIEAQPFIDDDKSRADAVQRDVVAKLVSKETATKLRGYEEGEAERIAQETERSMQNLTGGGFGGGEGAP